MNAPAITPEILALADALRPALLRASRRLRAEAQRAGASAIDAQILGTVKKSPGIGLSALAEREQMTKPSMSSHLKRLEGAGLVERAPAAPADRRRKGLRLTARGARALDAIRRRRNDWLAGRLSTLAPEARAALAEAALPLLDLAGEGR
ncbi:MAG TPA: MarR family transcriptional regulator [Caulobacteraceae bacterium]|nr:MarR family transcriptional regulator [Caulobacteraceae bacterium]